MLRFSLPDTEFDLFEAENTKLATQQLYERRPDLILLDWMLPGQNGIDFIKWIRKQENLKNIPIIMLTARAEDENKIKGLTTGADDYITKPFSPDELIARIKAILRRGPIVAVDGVVELDDIILNIDRGHVQINHVELSLTPIEYKMLHFFMTHTDKIYSREQLINHIWGTNSYIDNRSVDVQIRRLRKKLKPFHHDQRIQAIRSVGYLFKKDGYEKR